MGLLTLINPVGAIIKEILAVQRAKAAAKTDRERQQHEERLAELKGQLDLAQTAAEHDKWWSPRTIMAYCATIYVFKIVVWDTVLGWGFTENPGSQVTGIVMVIVGFFYGSKALTDFGAKIITSFRKK